MYIEDYLFDIFYNLADQDTKDAMDIAYLTSQRPADTLKITVHHIRDGELAITQNKTGAKLRFAILGSVHNYLS
ncbi:site-specific integrase [Paralysiella testudinis]|uniref:Uncharacterized protein n=1 Tax=Paralysiella testudinis TaxID=2809020 RepID=A0A892ZDM3_9NEIS|nr:hypothetical protein [Paralysiella testudinis]QRQ81445.1 hypothetical protein JQU52_12140 [Paralysiella testudinis]